MAGDSTTDSPPTPPNKRLKIAPPNSESTIQGEPISDQPQDQAQSAGDNDSDPKVCGICLSDGGGRAVRGKIDSCDHFFCFVCIMEWAKVESRCPMCKRRFTSIHRPPKDGVFASARIVNVPQRDQLYHLCGNATSGPSDPYSEVKCSVCHGMADESLLLLCDLCDSAAHTYCVGLGATVPEGDWFCHDCALSRSEGERAEVDMETDGKILSGNSNLKLLEENVSVFDIVRESNSSVFSGHKSSVSSLPTRLRPLQVLGRELYPLDEVSVTIESRNFVRSSTESGTRTLGLRRNVHNRIRVLRENWHSLQSRSLSFSSSMAEYSDGSRRKDKQDPASVFNYGSSGPSSSTSKKSNSQDSSVKPMEDLYDVDKAWKMMNIAKSMQKSCKRTSSDNSTTMKPSFLGSASKEAISSPSLPVSKIQQLGARNEERNGKQKNDRFSYHDREREKEMEMQKRMVMNIDSGKRATAPHYLSSIKFRIRNDDYRVNGVRPYVENAPIECRESSSTANKDVVSSCSTRLIGPVLQLSTDPLPSFLEFGASEVDIPEGRTKLEKICSKNKNRKDDNVKSEIQSLVKLNLKLLSQDKQLGVYAFKQIARLATHTILAACGFPHSASSVRYIPNLVCSHTDDIKLQHKSSLMPNSCRQCFYAFVRDVVCSVMMEEGLGGPSKVSPPNIYHS